MTRIASATLFAATAVLMVGTEAFSPRTLTTSRTTMTPTFLAKKKEDLSYLETRDMTKEEMLELNKQNEDIMNMELTAMTGFSLVLSLPIFYLCWVAFFSD
jgi:selenocysteine-specific elongation factor